jgi:hypothetical protein
MTKPQGRILSVRRVLAHISPVGFLVVDDSCLNLVLRVFQVQEFTRRKGASSNLKVFTRQAHVLMPGKAP